MEIGPELIISISAFLTAAATVLVNLFNARSQVRKEEFEEKNRQRHDEVDLLRQEVARLHGQVDRLTTENNRLHEENISLRKELAFLRGVLMARGINIPKFEDATAGCSVDQKDSDK